MEVHIEMNVRDAQKTVNLKICCWQIILKVRGQRKCYQQNVLRHQSMKKNLNSDSDELELPTETDIRAV